MKLKFFPFLVILILGVESFAQTETTSQEQEGVTISLGYGIHSNSLNRNDYLEFQDPSYEHLDNLETYTLKMAFPTKKAYLNLLVGAVIEMDTHSDSNTGYTPGSTNSHEHSLNGGGVFIGVQPIWKKKNFGLTSEFGLGAFSYKETYSHFNNLTEPFYDIDVNKTTFGLGGFSSIGFYFKLGRFGINPNLNAIITGGENGSFLFYGVSLPLTIQL